MSILSKHTVKSVHPSLVIRWKCRNCGCGNVSVPIAKAGGKELSCRQCFDVLRILLTVNQFAYHYRQLA